MSSFIHHGYMKFTEVEDVSSLDAGDLLALVAGLFWTVAYILIIVNLSLHRLQLYIPILAFSMNIVWEFVYSFIIPVPAEQDLIDRVWFVLDVIILILSWRNYFWMNLGRPLQATIMYLVNSLLIGVFINWMFAALLGPATSALYSAFMINVGMSYLFLFSGEQHPDFWIALTKCLGTAITSVYSCVYLEVTTTFMVFTYILVFVLDVLYLIQTIVAFIKARREKAEAAQRASTAIPLAEKVQPVF